MGQARTAAVGLHNWLIERKGLDMPVESPVLEAV
jgi:hypothetical protein